MVSPFKTHETMDLARALQEEDSESYTRPSGISTDIDPPTPLDRQFPIDPNEFGNLVVTKDSSTELIPTQLVDESSATEKTIFSSNSSNNNKPPLMLVRDMNAGKGLLDDDGKPVVGKVFSRVIQISGSEGKPKQLKAHHRGRSSSSCCRDRHASQDKERSSSARPQSGQQQRSSGAGQQCPTCSRQFSDETVMERHIVFCTGSSKEIM